MAYPFIMKDTFVSITIGMKTYNIDSTHPKFQHIRNAIKAGDWDAIEPMLDTKLWFVKRVEKEAPTASDKISIDYTSETIKYCGMPIHNTLTTRLFNMWKEGFDVNPMVKFLKNLMDNPSSSAVNELYDFMETGNMPITEDGCFLAYKKVRSDYKDIYSGTFDNSVGQVCEMPRNLVDDNRRNECSTGLHFCSQSYLNEYGNSADVTKVMLVKINPADVVSIPVDYNYTKGRCWKYEVYGEVDSVTAHRQETFTSTVVPETETPVSVEVPSALDNIPEGKERFDWANPVGNVSPSTVDEISLSQLLSRYPNSALVKIFNTLTGNDLVKFRDKETGIKRIVGWMVNNPTLIKWAMDIIIKSR